MRTGTTSYAIAYPGDMEILKRVFEQTCRDHIIDAGSSMAEAVASAAMSLFQNGVVEQSEFSESLAEFIRRRSQQPFARVHERY